jgi:hypothetical protein
MYALPNGLRDGHEPLLSGVACPDCCGMLAVHPEGKRWTLVFECRVGHTYMLEELLAAKEERLDEQLWRSYTALVELAALLGDVCDHERSETAVARYREREIRARGHAERLRELIEKNGPVVLPAGTEGPSRELP